MKKGFTLIELLVVIVIISILAAILFPVFASAREKSRQTTCASNEKQIGIGILQYLQDYDEMMPAAYSYNPGPPATCTGVGVPELACQEPLPAIFGGYSGLGIAWPYTVGPYIAQMHSWNGGREYMGQTVFNCPDMPTNDSPYGPEWSYFPNSGCGSDRFQSGLPYCIGYPSIMAIAIGTVAEAGDNETAETSLSYSKIIRVSDILLMTEQWGSGLGGYCEDKIGQCPEMFVTGWWGPNSPSPAVYNTHSGGSNCLMVDGHVKWYSANQIWSNYNDMWAEDTL